MASGSENRPDAVSLHIETFDHVVPVMSGYWLVKPPGTETRREIVAFRNWLLKEMSQLARNGQAEIRAASQSA